MSQISQIKAQVFKTDNYEAWRDGCNPIPYIGVSTDYESQGERWQVPIINAGVVVAYEETYEDASLISGAFKTVRLRNKQDGHIMYILGTETEWIDFANNCCGETPEMTEVEIPSPLIEDEPCCDSTIVATECSYEFNTTAPVLVVGQKLTLTGDNNGVEFTPAAPGAGFANVAAALAWAIANWGAYGTFTAVGTLGIKLTTDSISKGNFNMALLAQAWCMTIVVADEFDTVKNLNVASSLGKTVVVATATQVITEIKDYFADGVLTAFSATKINYFGTGVPNGILSGTTVVRSFVAGACA